MTTEQITALVAAVLALLQVITIAVGIWNKNHLAAVRAEQEEVKANLAQVTADGKELRQFLAENLDKAP